MLWIIGIVLVIIGLFFIVSGFIERGYVYSYTDEEYKRLKPFEKLEKFEEQEKPEKKVKGAGVILIGPIPIVFGESKFAVYALVLAIILMLISVFVMLSL